MTYLQFQLVYLDQTKRDIPRTYINRGDSAFGLVQMDQFEPEIAHVQHKWEGSKIVMKTSYLVF